MITVTMTYDEAVKLAVDCLKDRQGYYYDNGRRYEMAGYAIEAERNYARKEECVLAINHLQAGRVRY